MPETEEERRRRLAMEEEDEDSSDSGYSSKPAPFASGPVGRRDRADSRTGFTYKDTWKYQANKPDASAKDFQRQYHDAVAAFAEPNPLYGKMGAVVGGTPSPGQAKDVYPKRYSRGEETWYPGEDEPPVGKLGDGPPPGAQAAGPGAQAAGPGAQGEEAAWGHPRELADLISMATMIRDRAQAGNPMSAKEIAAAKQQQRQERAEKNLDNLMVNLKHADPRVRAAAQQAEKEYQQNQGRAEKEFGPFAGYFRTRQHIAEEAGRAEDARRANAAMEHAERERAGKEGVAREELAARERIAGGEQEAKRAGFSSQEKIAQTQAASERERAKIASDAAYAKNKSDEEIEKLRADSPEVQFRRRKQQLEAQILEDRAAEAAAKPEPPTSASSAMLKMNEARGKSDVGHRDLFRIALENYARGLGSAQGSAVVKDAIARGPEGLDALATAMGAELQQYGIGLSRDEAQAWAKMQIMLMAGAAGPNAE